jgi:hypothetical protein
LRIFEVITLCVLFSLAGAPAHSATRPMPRALPASVGDWTASSFQWVTPDDLESFLGPDAAVVREAGIEATERASYSAGKARELWVTLFHMRDSSAAYGAYTFLRTADMSPSDLAEKSAVSRDRILVVEGNLLLDASGAGAASLSDLKSLVVKIGPVAEMAPYPTIWQYLPAEGLIPNSDHYLLGPTALNSQFPVRGTRPKETPNGAVASGPPLPMDWLGFDDGAEGEIARYRRRGEIASLLLVRYPTRQIATKYLNVLGKIFEVNPTTRENPCSPDRRLSIYVVRKSALLAIVAGTASESLAVDLIRDVQYETSLTWSEPPWKATEKPFIQMLYDVFVGTGVILAYGLVASLAFGLVRLAIKRLLPNRVFDRPGQLEVLQLGIYSKPIEAKDFYSDERPN